MNPHDCNSHTDLNRARLPIPPFLRIKLIVCCVVDIKCRKRDLNPHDCNSHTDLNRARLPIPPFLRIKLIVCCVVDIKCRKRDLNPHDCNSHTDLNRARLPIPPFLHIKLLCCPAADKAYNTTSTFKCQHFFSVFSNAYFLYFFEKLLTLCLTFGIISSCRKQ